MNAPIPTKFLKGDFRNTVGAQHSKANPVGDGDVSRELEGNRYKETDTYPTAMEETPFPLVVGYTHLREIVLVPASQYFRKEKGAYADDGKQSESLKKEYLAEIKKIGIIVSERNEGEKKTSNAGAQQSQGSQGETGRGAVASGPISPSGLKNDSAG